MGFLARYLNQLMEQAQGSLAKDVILRQDLNTLKRNIKKSDLKFNEKNLPEVHRKIEKILGLKFKPVKINFVNCFPKDCQSYETRGASALSIPKKCIYFLNRRVDNTSTTIHVIHEQIHACLAQHKDSDNLLIEWFEEGLTIFYSLILYYELTKDFETIEAYRIRSYLYNKVKPEWDFTKNYFEYMKIFPRIFLNGGYFLVRELQKAYLAKNKSKLLGVLKKAEELPIKFIPKKKIEQFCCGFSSIVNSEKITPLEYLIVHSVKRKPLNISDISLKLDAPEDLVKKSLGSLIAKGICLMTKNGVEIQWRKRDLFEVGLIKPILN